MNRVHPRNLQLIGENPKTSAKPTGKAKPRVHRNPAVSAMIPMTLQIRTRFGNAT
jgi:hypothetical protein